MKQRQTTEVISKMLVIHHFLLFVTDPNDGVKSIEKMSKRIKENIT